MIRIIINIIVFFLVSLQALTQQKQTTGFKFQLNHIDISIDTITFHSILNNKFFTDTFSSIIIP